MTKSTFLLRRLAISLVAFAFVAGLCASTANAAFLQHSLSGNGRSQIGNGLPIPIGFSAVPNGKIAAQPGAFVSLSDGPNPKAVIVPQGAFRYGKLTPAFGFSTGAKQNIGVIGANPAVFQVATQLAISGGAVAPPVGHTSWKAGGRTGAATVSFCAGSVVTPVGNPGCLSAGAGAGINGRMRFVATGNQFGGPGQSRVAGVADVAIVAGGAAPGLVTAIFAFANPAASGAQGAPFGWTNMTAGVAPGPLSGLGVFIANTAGSLVTPVAPSIGAGLANPATSFGGPWTTGMVTISVTAAVPPEVFVLTGADNRGPGGQGSLSMVSGSVSARLLSGPNANRGWSNLVIGGRVIPDAPAMSSHGLAAVFGLLALAGGYVVQRRRNRA